MRKRRTCGGVVAKATPAEIRNQAPTGMTINAATGQAMGFADALGLDPRLFLEAIQGGAADSAYAQVKGGIMAERSWDDPSFALDSVRKDVGLMVDSARSAGFPDDLLAALLGLYDRASEDGHGGHDMAAVRAAFDV